jgi:hypothetical protein
MFIIPPIPTQKHEGKKNNIKQKANLSLSFTSPLGGHLYVLLANFKSLIEFHTSLTDGLHNKLWIEVIIF